MVRFTAGLLISLVVAAPIFANGISVSQSLNKTNIDFTDSVQFEIVLEWDGSQMAYLFDKPLSPSMNGLKVRRFASSIGSNVRAGSEVTTKRFLFVLEPTMAGLTSIEPVTIGYVRWPDSIPGQLLTEAITVSVAPMRTEIKPRPSLWYVWVLVGLAVVAAGGVVVLAIFRRSRRPVSQVITPRDEILSSLAEARGRAGGDMKQFQTDVHKILVAFLRSRYNIDATNPVRETLTEQLGSAGVAGDDADKICQWLLKAQKDKYVPAASSPGETVRLESELREFFERFLM